jgi:hypothetical protein
MECLNVKTLTVEKNMMEVMDLDDFVVKNVKDIMQH